MILNSAKTDKEEIRRAATGHWPEIISTIGGVSIESLDGKHNPCPKCGGEDRFRMIDEAAGAVLCNQCGKKNGDGFESVKWALGCSFPEAKERIAEHLGNKATKGGKVDPAKGLEWQPWSSTLVKHFLAAKPGITEAALLAAGTRLARYKRQLTVIAIPIIGQALDASKPVGWCLYNYSGGTIPKWSKDGEVIGKVKIKITYGSQSGLVGVHALERLQTAGMAELVWKVEGVTDLLALMSAIPEQLCDRHLVTTNANGAGETPRWPASILAGHNCNVIHDADHPGQAGAEQWSAVIAAQSSDGQVRNVQLPYPRLAGYVLYC